MQGEGDRAGYHRASPSATANFVQANDKPVALTEKR